MASGPYNREKVANFDSKYIIYHLSLYFQVDLNRAFPTWDDVGETRATLVNRSEPEVAAVIGWVLDQPFVLSANFHDGAVVANYPYDDSNLDNGLKSLTPDDATFVSLSRLYAARHRTMSRGSGLCDADNFPGGITNGAEWYVVEGGMQVGEYILIIKTFSFQLLDSRERYCQTVLNLPLN